MLLIQFVLDDVLGYVLKQRGPARHLVRLFRDALLARHLVDLLPVALCSKIKSIVSFFFFKATSKINFSTIEPTRSINIFVIF